MPIELEIHTDPASFDLQMITDFLSQTYWAEGRTTEQVRTTIENSHCFGAFIAGEQIGFARVVTDRVAFAYLMDVFVLPEHRNQGHATTLMQYILDYPEFADIHNWLLKTRDAQSFYERLGFQTVVDAERMMSRRHD